MLAPCQKMYSVAYKTEFWVAYKKHGIFNRLQKNTIFSRLQKIILLSLTKKQYFDRLQKTIFVSLTKKQYLGRLQKTVILDGLQRPHFLQDFSLHSLQDWPVLGSLQYLINL